MEDKAKNVIQNVGAMAEITSVFYNSISRQVPKDVALILTQHFMDIAMTRPMNADMAAVVAKARNMLRQMDGNPKPEKPAKPQEPEKES